MKLIHEMILENAARFPGKTAVSDEYGDLSYGSLASQTGLIAEKLVRMGFAPGDRAAVYVPYSKDILTGAVAVLRAGCAFVPFDSAYPKERLEYMLRDSDANAVLTVRKLWEDKPLDFPENKVIFMDEMRSGEEAGGFAGEIRNGYAPDSLSADLCDGDFPSILSDDSPAMLLYTSGTTGNPKGILHSHRMLLRMGDFLKVHEDTLMTEDSVIGIMSGFTFVATEMFVWSPMLAGATIHIAPEAARKDAGCLYKFMKDAGITHIFLPSSLAAIMAEDYDLDGIYVFAAGEKLRNFKPHNPCNCLINLYGSTEISGIFTKKICGNDRHILVGRPYKNTEYMVVDEEYRPAEPGEAGELIVSNDYMATGYLNLPELSAKKWKEISGRTWFLTGDRAVMNTEGDCDILGRTDDMVKLRGFRIETGEVEAQTAAACKELGLSDVGQIVVVLKHVSGADHLACYYEAGTELDTAKVREIIARKLTEYMIPDIWVRLDKLPRNANGKVMRKELPDPQKQRRSKGTYLDGEVIARIVWTAEDILKTEEPISPDDRFTELGGTSLTAMSYASRLREQGIKIKGSDVLRLDSFREIEANAEVAYEQLWTPEEYEAIANDFAQRGEHIEKVLPLSDEQDEMLFEQLIHPDVCDFKKVAFLQIDSRMVQEHLRAAIDAASVESEALRSAVVFHKVRVIQQAVTDRKIPLEVIEVEDLGVREMDEIRKRLLSQPMDLQRDSLARAVCINTKSSSYLVVMTHKIAIKRPQLREFLTKVMGELRKYYPQDVSVRDWEEVFGIELPAQMKDQTSLRDRWPGAQPKKLEIPEICVYSAGRSPKMVFVHTGNTGSDAYYRLADRLREKASFAVIEPYNLYHPDTARYGIKSIAENYVGILKRHQPEGPYILGGWCYGGVVAHEMACQLQAAGEEVRKLILLDAHALGNDNLRELSGEMLSGINREYFETCPLFAELREAGMLDAMVSNAAHVTEDLRNHTPSVFDGDVLYFKPMQVPEGVTGETRRYWEEMMKFDAGNYENYVNRDRLRIVHTPHEHDLMMDDESLAIILPEICRALDIE